MDPAALLRYANEHLPDHLTEIRPLAGEVATSFYAGGGASAYKIKVYPADYDSERLLLETEIVRHLAGKQLPFATPRIVHEGRLAGGAAVLILPWHAGRTLDELRPLTKELRQNWGRAVAQLNNALRDAPITKALHTYAWNPSETLQHRALSKYFSAEQKILADSAWDHFERDTLPHLAALPRGLNYNDGHGANVLADEKGTITAVFDFADVVFTERLNELAIACAYAAMDVPDPIGAMADLITLYAEHQPINHPEHLLNLVRARLLITVSLAARRAVTEPENLYHQVSAAPAWSLLERLDEVHPSFATAVFRTAAGHAAPGLIDWKRLAPVSPVNLVGKSLLKLDLSVGSLQLGLNRNFEDLPRFTRHVSNLLADNGADFAYGGYGETRPVYTTDAFAQTGNDGPRWRTVHLGLDIWGPVGTAIVAPLDGYVHSTHVDPAPGSYGPTIILEHELPDGGRLYTLYGHLAVRDVNDLRSLAQQGAPRQSSGVAYASRTRVRRGDQIATFGRPEENGGWPPHLHFQVMTDMLGLRGDFPGVAFPEEAEAMLSLCPSPLAVFNLPPPLIASNQVNLSERRAATLGKSLSVSYAAPLHIVRGAGQYLYDQTGRRYLDTVNNVAHVGHEHPKVVEAIQRQAAVLNTNSRYLHDNILQLAEELTATLPPELSVVHFVNSGSEANDLALRMCAAWSGSPNVLAVETGYHGHTERLIGVSSYKFNGKGGRGAPGTTDLLPLPDVRTGLHRDPAGAGRKYGDLAQRFIAARSASGESIGSFIAESILSCGGQIVLPDDYLATVYAHVREQGGLCIADEVQTGLGRVGSHWWGFELQGVVPDIVTVGKPFGNGHPLAAVVCTPRVAEAFANGMEYFNTFGGNPVSCAAGLAVLAVVREEGLLEKALTTGNYLKQLFRELRDVHPLITDVRGAGLFLGFELETDAGHPATKQAAYLKNQMRELGFLMSTDGPHENVLKVKPPMCFTPANGDLLAHYLDRVLKKLA
ncbi:aminotransferase class III-fold pyridoxal phosphate-dependent enzyme [Neolewinella antarctica]|uniref:4-aminobutyrate aminotransferase-like enzyme/Ser/Thr protein kinase RdoA (MazF antagonist) n=1 Tax=Neolewinella antarctica TaxID=442734 RepID=A0ABX0X7W6_9BACT|nr:aminotransferase class III-fold pyridoxal phosphate-dependent enzyme [Neolewinella antarctica]NJC25329.1 4-aminobutyrate aminotransferase-like enzyme/Ser/Thr protein kinase RdoA (MazF antagonist) [Neolewinella antarctica]